MAVGPSGSAVRGVTHDRTAAGAEQEDQAKGCRVGKLQLWNLALSSQLVHITLMYSHLTENLTFFKIRRKWKIYSVGEKKKINSWLISFPSYFCQLFISSSPFSSYFLYFVRHKIKVEFSLPSWKTGSLLYVKIQWSVYWKLLFYSPSHLSMSCCLNNASWGWGGRIASQSDPVGL